jgi:PKD repeat protein
MAIVASFTSSKVSGLEPPSEAIVFTDTSTGSPDSWHWDFGDGTYSDQQNPTHTFTGGLGDKYTVTLTAYKQDNAIVSRTGNYNSWREAGPEEYPDVYTTYSATSWGAGAGQFVGNRSYRYLDDPNKDSLYTGVRCGNEYSLSAFGSLTIGFFIEISFTSDVPGFNRPINSASGSFRIELDSSVIKNVSAQLSTAFFPVYDISGQAGAGSFDLALHPNDTSILPDGGTADFAYGYLAYRQITEKKATAEDEMDNTSQTIAFQGPEYAKIDFVGTPLTGTSPLTVQFTDLSVVNHQTSVWDFGDGNTLTVSGSTNPSNTYTTDQCSLDLL